METALLSSIASQMMNGSRVEVNGSSLPVRHTNTQKLKTVTFTMDAREYTAIEQSPQKLSRWGQLAREGHRVVQFKDEETGRFVAVSVDGQLKMYGARS
jgi:hypothetical protein